MSYEWRDEDVDYALRALAFVAAKGHLLLSDYTFYADTGKTWRNRLMVMGREVADWQRRAGWIVRDHFAGDKRKERVETEEATRCKAELRAQRVNKWKIMRETKRVNKEHIMEKESEEINGR